MKELRRLSIIWGLLLFAVFSLLTFFALKWKFKTEGYFKLEDKLVNITKSYFETKYSYPKEGEEIIVSYKELKEKELLTELKKDEDECDGYVLVSNKGVIDYKGYIKCSNYTTKDFDKHEYDKSN